MKDSPHSLAKVLESIRSRFDWNASGKLLVYCVVIGCLTGLCSAGIYSIFLEVKSAVQAIYPAVGIDLPQPEDYTATTGPLPGAAFDTAERKDVFGFLTLPRYWILILLIPTLGGLLCGFIIRAFAPDAFGDGTDHAIRSFHKRNGTLRNRVPLTKTASSFLTLGSGGSAGVEGPVTLFSAWTANCLSRGLQLNTRDRRTLLLAGASGGIGGLFQIPLGGAFFAVEVLYASSALELAAILPCILASIVGFSVFRYIHGDVHFIMLPDSAGIHSPFDPMMFILFVPFIALSGLIFITCIRELRNRFFLRLPIADWVRPALGGFLLGCIALVFPQVLGGGYVWMYHLLNVGLPFLLILTLILPKMLATALTVSSGGSGGLFAPSLFIGGLVGGALGHAAHFLFAYFNVPYAPPDITMCVLVGMSVFFAGIAKLPFAAAIIVCEMSGFHYEFLIPLILLNLLHIAIQSPKTSLYSEQVLAPIDSEAHFGHYSTDLLKVLSVRDAFEQRNTEYAVIPKTMAISEAIKFIASKPESAFPVLDEQGKFVGMVNASEIWGVFRHKNQGQELMVEALVQTLPLKISLESDLYTALRICLLENITELPVVSESQPDVLQGMLRRSDILSAYNNRLAVARWG
ncbi:MAG: chloride channel protein [Planctomycetaceae bacterium]|nr:chloride channel protein [Planctomycetaceae bacterium]